MRGWKLLFDEEIEVLAELPAQMNGAKRQQFRWSKGTTQLAIKLLWDLLLFRKIPLDTKFQAFVQLYKEYCVSSVPCPICYFSYITKPRYCNPPRPLALIFRANFLYFAWPTNLHMYHKKTLARSMVIKVKAVLVLSILCDWHFCQ